MDRDVNLVQGHGVRFRLATGLLVSLLLGAWVAPALANERLTNGDFSLGSAGWTNWIATGSPPFINYNSPNTPTSAAAPGLEIMHGNGNFRGGVYQALKLVPGQTYAINVLSRDLDASPSNAIAEVAIGIGQPVNGSPYTGGNPPGTQILKRWISTNCNNWDGSVGCSANAPSFVATASTMYLVLSCGQLGVSPTVDVAFDNVSVMGPDPCAPPFVNIIYVNAAATGANNGTSWTNAFTTLDDALTAAELNTTPCDQIWVAAGIYTPAPSTTEPRGGTFKLVSHVAIYGGFNGFESSLGQRMPIIRDHTILTHDSHTSRFVVTGIDTDGAVLDGFTVRAAQQEPPECVAEFFLRGGQHPDRDTISNNFIVTQRDRYLDLDPDPTAPPGRRPILSNNQFLVSIDPEPKVQQGVILELRTRDDDCGVGCTGGAFHLQESANPMGGYNDAGALEELTLFADARVTLADRAGFDFSGLGTNSEAIYVRRLKLYPNAVLNTGRHRLYFQQLVDENNNTLPPVPPLPGGRRIVDIPLPGFSLNPLDFNEQSEFDCRVRTRLGDGNPGSQTGSIVRQDIVYPPGTTQMAGVMHMKTLSAESVAAKAAFSRAGDEPIIVKFSYRFRDAEPGTELIVKLSASPVPGSSDGIVVGRVSPPPHGPGSIGSDRFGHFRGMFMPSGLNFRRGTYIEIELSRGGIPRAGRSGGDPEVEINEMEAEICPICGDFNASGDVTELDYLRILAAYGQTAEAGGGTINECLDLTTDQYIDLADLVIMDMALQFPEEWGTLCPPNEGEDALLRGGDPPGERAVPLAVGDPGTVYISGKQQDNSNQYDFIYTLSPGSVTVNGSGVTSIAGGVCPINDTPQWTCAGTPNSRASGPLMKDNAGDLYQVHTSAGLYRLTVSGNESRSLVLAAGSQSYGGGSVRVGVTFPPSSPRLGIALTDAVVRLSGATTFVYAVPVLVTPAVGDPYHAAAKLQLTGGGAFTVSNVYGRSSDPQHLWEIEAQGDHVFVTGTTDIGDDYVLAYSEVDTDPAPELSQRLGDLFGNPNDAPVGISGFLVSGSRLFLGSKAEPAAITYNRLFRFRYGPGANQCNLAITADGSVDINKAPAVNIYNANPMAGHIVSVAENPADGKLWVAGIVEPTFGLNDSMPIGIPLFSTPTLALVEQTWFTSPPANPQAATLTCHDLALPASIAFDDPAPVTIVAWRSVRTHTGLCDLSIALDPAASGNGSNGPDVESRSGGIQRIQVDFTAPVTSPNATNIIVSDGTNTYSPSSVSVSASTLTINFNAGVLPDEKCYIITLNAGAVAQALSGDIDCRVRALVGDTTGNGIMNLGDVVCTNDKAAVAAAASACPHHDVNLSGGSINATDVSAIKTGVTRPSKKALCP